MKQSVTHPEDMMMYSSGWFGSLLIVYSSWTLETQSTCATTKHKKSPANLPEVKR
jgi:hypothetical protein